jgi:hypothetical protein
VGKHNLAAVSRTAITNSIYKIGVGEERAREGGFFGPQSEKTTLMIAIQPVDHMVYLGKLMITRLKPVQSRTDKLSLKTLSVGGMRDFRCMQIRMF